MECKEPNSILQLNCFIYSMNCLLIRNKSIISIDRFCNALPIASKIDWPYIMKCMNLQNGILYTCRYSETHRYMHTKPHIVQKLLNEALILIASSQVMDRR